MFLARLIPRILHNVNRVCYIFGGHVQHQIIDITYTRISRYTLAQIRQADAFANEVNKLILINVSISITNHVIIIHFRL